MHLGQSAVMRCVVQATRLKMFHVTQTRDWYRYANTRTGGAVLLAVGMSDKIVEHICAITILCIGSTD